jgi:hypothetical protein
MALWSRRATFRLAAVLAMVLVALPLSSCGRDKQAADKCAQQAKPARAGQTVTWSGIEFSVPVGWYPVRVCFHTMLAMPVGYLTTGAPHAQCDGNTCGPPVDHLGESDVVVMAEQSTTWDLRAMHPNAIVAGRPAQIRTRADGQFGASQTVEALVLLPHREVLDVTAYLGPSASAQHEQLLAMIRGGRLRAPA